MRTSSDKGNKRFIIIGAGISGILSAIKLYERGFENVVVYEKGDSVGGTWRENTYPGLTCDVPSHVYTYSFAPNPEWSQVFSPGSEIREYIESTAKKFGVHELIRFNTEVTSCEFDGSRWNIETKNKDKDTGDFVIAATGVLHHPHYPDIKGEDSFSGKILHSARWDRRVTTEGQRIAVVGNGSTGVQLVSELAPKASHLVHYQRTPQWIRPVENPPFSEEQRQLFRSTPNLLREMRTDPQFYEVVDRFSAAITDPSSREADEMQQMMEDNLRESVIDPKLREKLKPDHQAGCKRLVSSPDYYQKVQLSNVEVVTCGIERITDVGILDCDENSREFDLIVLATGFKAHEFMRPMKVVGKDGASLDRIWGNRPVAYYAISVPGFPNFFMLNGPNSPVGNTSLIDVAERQWEYIEQLVDAVFDNHAVGISATTDALNDFEERRVDAAKQTIFATGCNSWYLDEEGVPATWPWTMQVFYEAMERPRFNDYEFT